MTTAMTGPKRAAASHPDVSIAWALGFHGLFGSLHELVHLLAAWQTGRLVGVDDRAGALRVAARAAFGRSVLVSELPAGHVVDVARHAGWVASAVIAAITILIVRQSPSRRSSAKAVGPRWSAGTAAAVAAVVTAIEAASTDLFRVGAGAASPSPGDGSGPGRLALLLCGNFGVILINTAWAGTKEALDVLEKMVQITMMRGAQSGGVVTYASGSGGSSNKGDAPPQLRGIRTRVVNGKRTDLSELVRKKCEAHDGASRPSKDFVRAYSGHTRFATTSKATFDGTHPHQWCPPRPRQVYFVATQKHPGSTKRMVEHYITHNGDLDFFRVAGQWHELGKVQVWLEKVLECPMPATVDSACIAGLVDLHRTAGCWGLSVRYAYQCGLATALGPEDTGAQPTYAQYEQCGEQFARALDGILEEGDDFLTVFAVGENKKHRKELMKQSLDNLQRAGPASYMNLPNDVEANALKQLVQAAVNAFFDNDLMQTTRLVLSNSKGSFGLCITSSMDAHRQLCVAARGQTMSVAFYPESGLICYGSEQAAVKAGLGKKAPNGSSRVAAASAEATGENGENGGNMRRKGSILSLSRLNLTGDGSNSNSYRMGMKTDNLAKRMNTEKRLEFTEKLRAEKNAAVRLDLDDLGGEICLIDWGGGGPSRVEVSAPNEHLPRHKMMNGAVTVVLYEESAAPSDALLVKRCVKLEDNEFVLPLPPTSADPVAVDLSEIPKVIKSMNDDWGNKPKGTISLNRLTAWNLVKELKKRIRKRIDGDMESNAVDIMVTGCEVSLWLGEQFASDLQSAFPKLNIKAVSSNKILGLFGQDFPIPLVGHPTMEDVWDLTDTIVIIVSHSGGTFAPLACSNLMKAKTNKIFVVASEWDTQVGKQLRKLSAGVGTFDSRIFSTDVGVRPAEPCTISVVATQNLLTLIFEHICLVILSDKQFRFATGARITDSDLSQLERCNQDNLRALEGLVGYNAAGKPLNPKGRGAKHAELRAAGAYWSLHVLEGVYAWIMSAVYVFGTVTAGYPAVTGIATVAGLSTWWAFYITRFFDAAIYVFLPQICITIQRLWQGRPLLHRMTARTVVIGDCPWVAQSAEALLSKLFACSYSAAGIGVISGNPADHLVHRHTHRVVRGALMVCGRPDGRLSALTSLEATVCLSVNQASSIQSIGSTLESITIGHNPSEMSLTAKNIFLERNRPLFLCEKLLTEKEGIHPEELKMSAGGLLGAYSNLRLDSEERHEEGVAEDVFALLAKFGFANKEDESEMKKFRDTFDAIDVDGGGSLDIDEFTEAFMNVNPDLTAEQCKKIFDEADVDGSGDVDFEEFVDICRLGAGDMLKMLGAQNRDASGVLKVPASKEEYFGAAIRADAPKSLKPFSLVDSQNVSMQLYESRIASTQRFVAMAVMFHELGDRVQKFWPSWTFGYLGYRIDRTHSIMRIATTASPVSGAEVRDRINYLSMRTELMKAMGFIRRLAQNFTQSKLMQRMLRAEKTGQLGAGLAGHGMEKFISPTKDGDDDESAKKPLLQKQPAEDVNPAPSNAGLADAAPADLAALSGALSDRSRGRNPRGRLQPVVSPRESHDAFDPSAARATMPGTPDV
jgi:hypothetical protein